MWKLKTPISAAGLVLTLIVSQNGPTLTIVKDGIEKEVRVSSIQREDGSGDSFNVIAYDETYEPIRFYVRCI